MNENNTGEKQVSIKQKDRLRLLFVVSRPKGAGFIDPRADSKAVLQALEEEALGRFDVDFLSPATMYQLNERLNDRNKPLIDLVHFDGHGAFDATESKGYLLFTNIPLLSVSEVK